MACFATIAILTLAFLGTAYGAIRGANLGSLFVPEQWMVTFYDGTGQSDLCSLCAWNREEANTRILQHFNTWITEDHFKWMASQGVNSVRVPLGYWNIIQDPYNLYVPINVQDFINQINRVFDLAAKYQMTVLLDLHGAPGSQNGNDHSGCASKGMQWATQQNRDLTLQTIQRMMELFGKRSNLFGVELLNEPAYELEQNHHNELLEYYQAAYKIIRRYGDNIAVIFNVL